MILLTVLALRCMRLGPRMLLGRLACRCQCHLCPCDRLRRCHPTTFAVGSDHVFFHQLTEMRDVAFSRLIHSVTNSSPYFIQSSNFQSLPSFDWMRLTMCHRSPAFSDARSRFGMRHLHSFGGRASSCLSGVELSHHWSAVNGQTRSLTR